METVAWQPRWTENFDMSDVFRDNMEMIPLIPSNITPFLAYRLGQTVDQIWDWRGRKLAENGKPCWVAVYRVPKMN